MSKVVLSRHQSFLLYGWMEKHKAIAGSQTAEILAKSATKELGFPISIVSINSARKDFGIKASTQGGAGKPRSKAFKEVQDNIRTLAREMVDLRKKLNEPVSAELEEMSK